MLISEEDQKILGIHILGNPSSEIIAVGTIAIAEGYTLAKMQQFVFPHPTVVAIFQNIM